MVTVVEGTLLGGRYKVTRELDAGGMGVVYEAVQEGLGRTVALKRIHPHLADDPTFTERFRREAHAVAALGHPNIVQVTDFHADPGEPPFFVMEFLEGQSLKDLIRDKVKLSQPRACGIAIQILSALEEAHAAGLVHRDIKPGNVFVIPLADETDLAKLLDFGVATVIKENAPASGVGGLVGTVAYMAPETLLGGEVDARADLFGLGATLHHAMSGERPFDGKTPAELTSALLASESRPLEELVFGIDPELARIVRRSMEKEPADRFASAREMREALQAVMGPSSQSLRKTVEVRAMTIPEEARVSSIPATQPMPTPSAPIAAGEGPRTVRMAPPETDPRMIARVATMSSEQRRERERTLRMQLDLARSPGIVADVKSELQILAQAESVAIDSVPLRRANSSWIALLVLVAVVLVTLVYQARMKRKDPLPDVPTPAHHSRAEPPADARRA